MVVVTVGFSSDNFSHFKFSVETRLFSTPQAIIDHGKQLLRDELLRIGLFSLADKLYASDLHFHGLETIADVIRVGGRRDVIVWCCDHSHDRGEGDAETKESTA